MEKISVIIPTYKNRGGLDRAIRSVLEQDWADTEVIVVDDNPPDSESRLQTELLMDAYSKNSNVVYVKHERNKNGAAARNTGIRVSTGSIIAFLDDDDWFLQGKLQKQYNYLKDHSEYNAVYCLAKNDELKPPVILEGDCRKSILLLQSNFYTPSLMFYKDVLIKLNGFDETFRRHQDYELLLRFFKAGYKIGCVPEYLIEIGLNDGSNDVYGERLDNLKKYYFEKFLPYIDELETTEPGFKNQVYAIHYAGVFLSHLKTRNFKRALKVFEKYYFKCPLAFNKTLAKHIKIHLS